MQCFSAVCKSESELCTGAAVSRPAVKKQKKCYVHGLLSRFTADGAAVMG